MRQIGRSIVCHALSISLLANVSLSQSAQAGGSITRQQYESCQARNEQDFRTAIEQLTINALHQNLGTINYDDLVEEEWRSGRLNQVVDASVDAATDEVQKETSWATLIKSLASQETAQKLAVEVTERTYRSDAMKTAIEELVVGVGVSVGKQIELATRDASAPVLSCLKAFLGPRYGSTIALAVSSDAGTEFGLSPEHGGAEITPGSTLRETSAGITGAAILLVRRQLANIARQIGARIAGTILSRLVSVVAGGIGLVLIATDVWQLRNGVLPIIATEMKADTTKQKVREELAKSISQQLSKHIDGIGRQTANQVITIWQQFRSAHAKALDLAERNSDFKKFLNALTADNLAQLDEILALVLSAEGEQGVVTRLRDGTLNEAVTALPPAAMTIARESRSLETALKWSAVAGDDINSVVDYGIYRDAAPDDFTNQSLQTVLNIGDQVAITKLSGLTRETRTTLLELPAEQLKDVSRNLSAQGLKTLAYYLTGLEPAPKQRIIKTVVETPGQMQNLESDRVRKAILSSSDQAAAVDMMLRADGAFDPQTITSDVRAAWDGRVAPVLLWDKHPLAIGLAILVLLAMLLIIRRLFTLPSRRRSQQSSA